jgi:hypothetical protein
MDIPDRLSGGSCEATDSASETFPMSMDKDQRCGDAKAIRSALPELPNRIVNRNKIHRQA